MGSFNGNIGTPSGGFNLLVEYSISQNIAENYSDVTATGYVKRNNSSYYPYNSVSLANLVINGTGNSYTGSYNLGSDGYKGIVSNTVRVYHNNDGSKNIEIAFSFDGKLSNYYPIGSISQTITLPTIPRASEIACSSPYIGDTAIISIDKKSSSFTSTLTYNIGTLTGTIATKTSETTVQFKTNEIEDSIYALIPNGKEIQGTIYCTTYSGDTQIGDTKSTTFNLYTKESACRPDVSATIVDTNTSVTEITSSNTKFIKYISKPKVTISATAKNGSTIKTYSINLNDGQVSNLQEDTFTSIGSNKITVSAFDTRGYSSSIDVELDMIDYIKLHINTISITRPEGTSNEAILNCDGAYYNGSFTDTISNSLTASFKYRKSGETNWTDGGNITPTITDNTFKVTDLSLGVLYDYEEEYQFEISFEDKFVIAKEIVHLEKGQETIFIGDNEVYVYGNAYLNDHLINYICNSCIYSLEEIVIGKWMDETHYRKVIDFGALPNNTVKQVNHNISDIDMITRIYGIGYISGHARSYPIPLMYKGADSNYNVEILVTKQYVEMTSNTDRSNVFAYVVLEYTKTSTSSGGGMGNEPTV